MSATGRKDQRGYINMDGLMGGMIVFGVIVGLLLPAAWKYLIKPALTWLLTLLTGGVS